MSRAIVAILFLAACAPNRGASPPEAAAVKEPGGNTRVAVERAIVFACDMDSTQTLFELNSVQNRAEDKELERVADCLAHGNLKGRNVRVVGYDDPRAGVYERPVGGERAKSVAQYLESKGVSPDKIIKRNRAETYSASNDGRGFAFDRRVDITLAD